MRLKAKERCPLHGRRDCCGRAEFTRYKQARKNPCVNGVTKFPDGREKCSPAVLRQRKDKMLREGKKCIACGEGFVSYSDVELGHIESKGMNGSKRDDSWSNIGPIHAWTNRDQGSMSLEDYLKKLAEKGVKPCQQ